MKNTFTFPCGIGSMFQVSRNTVLPQRGFTFIGVIGFIAVAAFAAAVIAPNLAMEVDQNAREREDTHLRVIAQGITNYLRHNQSFPPSLTSLNPDDVSYVASSLSENEYGYARYYLIHPHMNNFNNATGLSANDVADARYLLISHLTKDAAPTIVTAAQFETWWTTDERSLPSLIIYRGTVGQFFHQLPMTGNDKGENHSINGASTHSEGSSRSRHAQYHLTSTDFGSDENST